MRTNRYTRPLQLAAVTATAALTLSSCGQAENLGPEPETGSGTGSETDSETDTGTEPGSGTDSDGATIRVAWWGSEGRHASTEEALSICQEHYPNVEIETEYASQGGGYEERLATQFAAGTPPDLIQVNSPHIAAYGPRGSLLDLDEVSEHIDLGDIPEAILATDMVGETIYAVPVTQNASAVLLNRTLLEAHEIEEPHHESWTWEELADYAHQASEVGDGSFWGLVQTSGDVNLLNIWARQLGHDDGLYDRDGDVGLDAQVIESFIQYGFDRQQDGATAPASLSVETQTVALEQRMAATNQSLLSIQPLNEIIAVTAASGSDFELLHLPVHEAGNNGQTFRSISWSITEQSDHPVEAAQILNCLQSDLDVADVLLAERGIPANQVVLEHIMLSLDEGQQMMAEFITELEETAPDHAPVPPPPGAESAGSILQRVSADVLFERADPGEAADLMVNELQENLHNVN